MSPAELPPVASRSELADGLKQGVMMAAAILALVLPPQLASVTRAANPAAYGVSYSLTSSSVLQGPKFADFKGEPSSEDARFVANWVADSGDNRNMSFVIIDKKNTRVYVFDAKAQIIGATPVLLGVMPGDDSVTGIGKRPINQVRPDERTTPAGRFVAEPGRNATGENVVWVDYDAAVSMHRVRIVDPKERRLERLASPTTADNRISYGCINVPVAFFENVLSPQFNARYGVVYVLPEIRTVRDVFTAAYEPAQKWSRANSAAGKVAGL